MVTYGGNRPTVNDDEVLTAQDFNDATRFWVTDELPDTGKDGDVVFVVGDPVGAAVGGGKVLQVVHAQNGPTYSSQSTSSTSFVPVNDLSLTINNIQPGSHVYLFAGFVARVTVPSSEGYNRCHFEMVDDDGNEVSGSGNVSLGSVFYGYAGAGSPMMHFYVSLLGHDANPGTSKTYSVNMRMEKSSGTVYYGNNRAPIFYAMEVSA